MKICHIAINNIFLPPYEGGGVHELEIAKNLSFMGNEVHMFIDRQNKNDKKFETMCGLDIHRLDIHRLKRKIFGRVDGVKNNEKMKVVESKHEIKKIGVKILGTLIGLASVPFILGTAKKCDIIYERSSSFGAGIFTSLILKKPIVVEVVDAQRCGFLLKFADHIITHFDHIIPKYINRNRVLIIENAVDHTKFNPKVNGSNIRKSYGLERNRIITYIGGFHPWHALDKIVIASKKIVSEFSDVKFLMVGEGPEKERITNMVNNSKLDKNFVFVGKITYDRIPEFLAASDILLSFYTDETYSHVNTTTKLCEYMAMGKPVIVYGVKEGLIKHMENAIVIKPNENIEESLERYCIELLKNKKIRRKLGNKAFKTMKKISWKDKAEMINNIFENLLK